MALDDLKLSDTSSADLGGYFLVTITDLDLATQYPIQFQYVYADGRKNDNWSAGRYFTTTGATVPNEPQLQTTDVVGGAGFVKVTWSGNDSSGNAIENFDRVDVHISGTTFGDGTKPAGSFKTAGTQTFSCVAGTYIVQLKVYSLNGSTSFFSSARTVTVTSATPAAESSVTPSTPTVSSVLGAIQLAWNGKTSSGGDQPYGFTAAKVYIGTTSGFTPSSSNQVDVLNFANGQNTLNIGVGTIVNGTALDYGTDYYVKIATTNGTDTSTPVSASGNPVQIGKVTSGDIVTVTADKIATGTLSSGSTITVGSTSGKHIKLSGTGDPFIIYGSGGTSNPVLSYNGTKLTIVGDGTFSGALSAATGTFTGTLSAASGSFSGTITASGGTIGGITIAAAALQNNSAESSSTFKLDSGGKARFGAYSGNAIIIDPSASVGGYYIYHSSNGGTTASSKFSVSTGGVLTATGGNFSGTITNGSDYWNSDNTFRLGGANGINKASSGSNAITIGSDVTISGSITANSLNTTSLDIASDGEITTTSGSFGVTALGVLSASGANIDGTLTANNGSVIGAWSVDTYGTLSAGLGLSATYLFSPTTTDPNGSLFAIYTNKEIYAGTGFSTGAGNGAITFTNTNAELSPIGNVKINGGFAPSYDNTYVLGYTTNRWQIVRSAGGVSTTSDMRTKTDISESDLGLNFINKLSPVKYKMIIGGNSPVLDDQGNKAKDLDGNYIYESRPGIRTHYGLIAQNVKDVMDEIGVEDFGGWQLDDKNDPNSQQGLVYHQFISPIIKSIQELSNKLNSIEARLDALEA